MPQSAETTTLSAKQANAVQLIALGWTRNRVATQLAIDPGTLSRWRRQPAFKQEVAKLLDQAERDSVESFRAIKLKAVERLSVLVDSLHPKIALRAIEMVMSRTDLTIVPIGAAKTHEERLDDQFDKILEDLLTG
jgi:transposase-like protein